MNQHPNIDMGFAMRLASLARKSHRWLSIVFTATVALNFAYRAVAAGEPPALITYAPLPPLFLQLLSGLYLFAVPYMGKRALRHAQAEQA
ncbi:hypothetical protein [Lysobacter sp. HA18]